MHNYDQLCITGIARILDPERSEIQGFSAATVQVTRWTVVERASCHRRVRHCSIVDERRSGSTKILDTRWDSILCYCGLHPFYMFKMILTNPHSPIERVGTCWNMLEHVGTCWNINMLEQQRKAICKAEEVNYIITLYISHFSIFPYIVLLLF